MNLIFFGPYGCGKGTQARIFSEKYNIPIFSTGDEIRRHMKEGTELGKKLESIVASGKLVSDDVIIEMVKTFLNANKGGFIFDGLPRTFAQADAIDALLAEKDISVHRFWIDIPESVSLERQIGRKTCPKCRAIFPKDYSSDACGECGTPFENRLENDRTVAEKRTQVYKEEILPVIEKYFAENKIYKIDGMLSVNEVTNTIEKHLK